MKRYSRLILFCCLGLMISACGGGGNNKPKPTPNDDAARIIASLVADLKGGSDLSIKAEGSDGEGVLATGSVDAQGNIKLELPKTVGEAFLLPLEPNDGCEFKPASNAKSFFLPNLNVYVKDKPAGVLVQEDNGGVLERVFVSEDATIECTNAEANASFKKGWNLLFTDKKTRIGKVIASSTAPWTFTGDITNPNPDTTPPTVLDTFATSATSVEVAFSEAIKGVAASAFSFPAQNLTVNAASLSADKKTVTLTTTVQTVNESYALLVSSGITDLAGNAFDLAASDPLARTFSGFNPSNAILEVIILGLPSGVDANVEVTGPNSFKQTLKASTTIPNLPVGTYTLVVNDVKPDSATFAKTSGSSEVVLTAGNRAIEPLVYTCSLVTPPDTNLDAALRVATGKATYNCADLAALTTFVEQLSIKNIEGLQYAVGLTSLNLFNNLISSLPSGIFDNMTVLTSLRLDNNELSGLPANIFDNLTALTALNLDDNQLSNLPENIFDNLTTLTDLNLGRNQLTGLPQTIFENLTTLTSLNLGNNKLSSLAETIFENLTALNDLILFNNAIGSLPENIFDNLTNLTFLNLGGNALSSLPENIFDNLTNVTFLPLDRNNLSLLPENIFDKMTALTALDLSANCLEAFKVPTRGQLEALDLRLTGFGASDNPKAGCAAVPQPLTFSNFDANAEGWTVTGDGTNLIHVATGGNPGGFIQATDGGQGTIWYWKAPALYYGDARDYIGKKLKFSLKQSATDSPFEDVDVILKSGPGFGFFQVAEIIPPGVGFTEYEITLTRENFTPVQTELAFSNFLSGLSSIEIRGEYRTGADIGGLDSVRFGE